MMLWRNIADALLRGIGTEARYRRDHPCETAAEFRGRQLYWEGCGRKVLARTASA